MMLLISYRHQSQTSGYRGMATGHSRSQRIHVGPVVYIEWAFQHL